MAAGKAAVKIRRIVVGLDFAPHSRPALEAAAALAGALDADLEALFVESDELHRLAGLPFARELGVSSAAARPMDPAVLERTLQAHAREARRALAEVAAPRSLRWSLRVTRGSVAEEIIAASAGADLTVVGSKRWAPEAARLARGAPATILVLPPSGRFRGPLAAICPVAVAPEHAIALAVALGDALGGGLTILVLAGELAAAGAWCERAGDLLRAVDRRAELEIVREDQPEALQAALERLAPRAVAIIAAPPVQAQ
jgi:nucleotide-binding universal stress UspA family protein